MNFDELILQNNVVNFNQSWHKKSLLKGIQIYSDEGPWVGLWGFSFKRMKKHSYRTNCHDFFSLSRHAGMVIALVKLVYCKEMFLKRVMWPMILSISISSQYIHYVEGYSKPTTTLWPIPTPRDGRLRGPDQFLEQPTYWLQPRTWHR